MDAGAVLAQIKAARPDLILMDIQLPDIDGLELTRRLKVDHATASIVIVALTAYAMKGDEETAREACCESYIAKLIETRTLAAAINSYRLRAGPLTNRAAP